MDWFDLGGETRRMIQAHQAALPEATVIYASRGLEFLANREVLLLEGHSSPSVYSALERLRLFGAATETQLVCFHSLRDLGNLTRHIRRPLHAFDSDLGLALTDRLLAWEVARHPSAALEEAAGLLNQEVMRLEVAEFLRCFDVDPKRAPACLPSLAQTLSTTLVAATPLPASLLGEGLIRMGANPDTIARVLGLGLEYHPKDRRLRLLNAWHDRSQGKVQEALREFEALVNDNAEDPEARGFLGGTYKRMATDTAELTPRQRQRHLQAALQHYQAGWERTKQTDTYCGINLATVALMMGKHALATGTAHSILEKVQERRSKGFIAEDDTNRSYYDLVTEAEALVLVNQMTTARLRYNRAFEMFSKVEAESISVTRKQLALVLSLVGADTDVDSFLNQQRQLD